MTEEQKGQLAIELYAEIAYLGKALAKTEREAKKVDMEIAMNGNGAERLAFLVERQESIKKDIVLARKRLAKIGY